MNFCMKGNLINFGEYVFAVFCLVYLLYDMDVKENFIACEEQKVTTLARHDAILQYVKTKCKMKSIC